MPVRIVPHVIEGSHHPMLNTKTRPTCEGGARQLRVVRGRCACPYTGATCTDSLGEPLMDALTALAEALSRDETVSAETRAAAAAVLAEDAEITESFRLHAISGG